MNGSSIPDEDRDNRPPKAGRRSGNGSDSALRYLQEELASKPQELAPADGGFTRPRNSLLRLAHRVRRALGNR